MSENIAVLIGVNIASNQSTADPLTLNLYPSPLMPELNIVKLDFSENLCFAGKIGGQLSDYNHPWNLKEGNSLFNQR